MQKRNGEEIIQVDECPGLPSHPSADLKIVLRKWEEANGYTRSYRDRQKALTNKPRKADSVAMRALSEYEIKALFRKNRQASKAAIMEFVRSLNTFDGHDSALGKANADAFTMGWTDADMEAVRVAIAVSAGISSL